MDFIRSHLYLFTWIKLHWCYNLFHATRTIIRQLNSNCSVFSLFEKSKQMCINAFIETGVLQNSCFLTPWSCRYQSQITAGLLRSESTKWVNLMSLNLDVLRFQLMTVCSELQLIEKLYLVVQWWASLKLRLQIFRNSK